MRTSAVLLFVLSLASVPWGGSSALAETGIPDCQEDVGCQTLKDQAAERSRLGDLTEALRLYLLAYQVRPDPRLLFNTARVLHKQGHPVEAVPYYRRFLDSHVEDNEQRTKAREYLEQIQAAHPMAATPLAPTPAPPTTKPAPPTATPTLLAATPAPPPAADKKPLYKRWWLWTIVGGVVVVGVTAGVAGGVAASRQLPDPMLRPF